MRRILVTGAPGTGRRTVGTLLELERGFRHVRVGERTPAGELVRTVADCAGADLVVTWTAPPAEDTFEWLRLLEFDFVCLERAGATRPGWRMVDPFERSGSLRPASALAAELLTPGASRRREHTRAHCVPRRGRPSCVFLAK